MAVRIRGGGIDDGHTPADKLVEGGWRLPRMRSLVEEDEGLTAELQSFTSKPRAASSDSSR
jgi:hypothetical protein